MKTRTNQPVDEIVVGNIKQLTGEQIDNLECGDIVCKEDETGKHSYVVTFKKDRVGICLTYGDGSGYIETVSYDYTNGAWVYNSTDVFNGGGTKLYKHTIQCSLSGSNATLIIINNSQTKIELSSNTVLIPGRDFISFGMITDGSDDYTAGLIININLFYITTDGSIGYSDIPTTSQNDDTVTEL